MTNTIIVINKKRRLKETAVYARTPSGNMRYHIDGKPLSDKLFDFRYTIEDASEIQGTKAAK